MKRALTLFAIFLAAEISTTSAQAPHEQHPGLIADGPYAPRLGDLMLLQQIRHAKMWFAVAANNWLLAGAIPAAVLALLVQGLFEIADRRLIPAGLR